jgi:hypothetical protein
MKINQIIINETTSAGAVATVAKPMGEMQTRTKVRGLEPAEKVMKGKAKKQGPYANSLSESKNKVEEAKLDEDDLIVVPGQGIKRKTGFVQHGQSRVDHEVEMARSDVLATMKNAKAIYQLLKDRSEDEGIEGWVQEKLIKANDYLNSVKEYYDEKMMREMTGGVIAAGGVGEGAKVDRMVKHIAKSERETGKSSKEAENIAWATVNKRGYLDNKNKKKGK